MYFVVVGSHMQNSVECRCIIVWGNLIAHLNALVYKIRVNFQFVLKHMSNEVSPSLVLFIINPSK